MFKLLPCCLALLAIAIGESADVQPRASDTQSMEQQHFRLQTLLTALETWVSSQLAIHEHPRIEFASPAKIVSLARRTLRSSRRRAAAQQPKDTLTAHFRHLINVARE